MRRLKNVFMHSRACLERKISFECSRSLVYSANIGNSKNNLESSFIKRNWAAYKVLLVQFAEDHQGLVERALCGEIYEYVEEWSTSRGLRRREDHSHLLFGSSKMASRRQFRFFSWTWVFLAASRFFCITKLKMLSGFWSRLLFVWNDHGRETLCSSFISVQWWCGRIL